MTAEYRHIPVMLDECARALALRPGQTYCDCTLGGAGHALRMAQELEPGGKLIGIDQDGTALEVAKARLSKAHPALEFTALYGNFSDMDELLLCAEIPGVDAFLFDLGVSSPQLDIPHRGFSYSKEAPLDMRMDPGKQTITAAEIINTKNETDLTRIFRNYGQERWAHRIAQFVVAARSKKPLETTTELADLVKAAIPASARATDKNPAKRVFQALRIAVNDELDALDTALSAALRWAVPGGRIVVMSYHSLEDAIVKDHFTRALNVCTCPAELPICVCGKKPIISEFTKKPLRASVAEIALNPRAKSARLRCAIKADVRGSVAN